MNQVLFQQITSRKTAHLYTVWFSRSNLRDHKLITHLFHNMGVSLERERKNMRWGWNINYREKTLHIYTNPAKLQHYSNSQQRNHMNIADFHLQAPAFKLVCLCMVCILHQHLTLLMLVCNGAGGGCGNIITDLSRSRWTKHIYQPPLMTLSNTLYQTIPWKKRQHQCRSCGDIVFEFPFPYPFDQKMIDIECKYHLSMWKKTLDGRNILNEEL